MQAIGGGARNSILNLTIKDKAVLYAAYMPFVKHGGLFIPTNKSHKLGHITDKLRLIGFASVGHRRQIGRVSLHQ